MRHECGNSSEDVRVSVGGAMEDIMGYFDHAKLLMSSSSSSSLSSSPQDGLLRCCAYTRTALARKRSGRTWQCKESFFKGRGRHTGLSEDLERKC